MQENSEMIKNDIEKRNAEVRSRRIKCEVCGELNFRGRLCEEHKGFGAYSGFRGLD